MPGFQPVGNDAVAAIPESPTRNAQAVSISAVGTVVLARAVTFARTISIAAKGTVSLLGFLRIVSRKILHDTVDYVMAGDSPIEGTGREYHIPPQRRTEKVVGMRSGLKRMGAKPSFTVRSTKK